MNDLLQGWQAFCIGWAIGSLPLITTLSVAALTRATFGRRR